jgi:uncharacterized membrane protein YqiK
MFALGGGIAFVAMAAVVFLLFVFVVAGTRYIPNNRVGVIEKRWSGKGSVKNGIIALAGEAGFQPQLLRGGMHFLMPFQYRVHVMPLVTIPQGRIGYVFARDGQPLAPTQTLASTVATNHFQDAEAFLRAGGQRGPQRAILREGTYAIHLGLFVVITEAEIYNLPMNATEAPMFQQMAATIHERKGFSPVIIKGTDDLIGIVTVHDGLALPQGQIIAPVVGEDPNDAATYHNNFQDPERFLAAGGQRGRQLQVLVDGTYYVNRLFATVEAAPKTIVEVGHVGVVVSYTGDIGADLSGKDYKHGELVEKGTRGVWSEPLLPGKYAFNTYAGKIIMVPTTNFILKWNRAEVGSHHFDENLSEVSLITKDAFEPSLPLSVVVHIDYKKAPLVVQRFGDIKKLVEQTLDPMVAAYFKNIGQRRTLIELLQQRAEIQTLSSIEMKEKFEHYNLELEEVLIGTPKSGEGDTHIETILMQLRSRQIAEEQVETYARQEKAAVKERELREAEARANQQSALTQSEISITVQSNEGRAQYQRSLQDAEKIRALAEAEADKTARIGIAQAIAIEEQVRAYGGPKFQVTQEVMSKFAQAIAEAKVDVVPRVVVGGSNGNGGNASLMEGLLAMLTDKLGEAEKATTAVDAPPAIQALRDKVRASVMTSLEKPNGVTPPSVPLGTTVEWKSH